jgi:hypothetical protein
MSKHFRAITGRDHNRLLLSQHVGSWVGLVSRPVHVMRHEDMLTKPMHAFGQLARFLRLSPTDQQLIRAIKNSFVSKLEAEHGFNKRPPKAKSFFREGRAGQWREVLSLAQIERIVQSACTHDATIPSSRPESPVPKPARSL